MSVLDQEKLVSFEDFLSDAEWSVLKEKWQTICTQEKKIQLEKEEIKNGILKKADDHEVCESGLFVRKANRKGNIDYKKIPELSMVDLEQYRKSTIEYWEIKVSAE